jgi:SAM-dependent methyltransferase
MNETSIKQEVREFYDRVGWHLEADGFYQNARYEDLRPVSRAYIHRCHLRVKRNLPPNGQYILDIGSGPIQYPEYITYSQDYERRICVDISIQALRQARQRIGERGWFVVADAANLPFKAEIADAVVTLHTFHHLPLEEQKKAYDALYHALKPGAKAVVVNGWTASKLMGRLAWLVTLMEGMKRGLHVSRGEAAEEKAVGPQPTGTFVRKMDAAELREMLGKTTTVDIRVWRSVSVQFLRTVIHPWLGGRMWLWLLFQLENVFPRFFGENGQYPLIVIEKKVQE